MNVDDIVQNEWRSLGFYYDRDDELHAWRLMGTREGLMRFPKLLRAFAGEPKNQAKSEHGHYGPHCYLKVMSWPDPGVGRNAIHGTPGDLVKLAEIAELTIRELQTGEIAEISEQYVGTAEYKLELHCVSEKDPSSLDSSLKNGG